jgi:ParB/RepB/Spo0J family partition protein
MSTTPAALIPSQRMIPVAAIVPSKFNPRKTVDQAKLAELTNSIKQLGVIQAIVVRPNGAPGKFEIVVGERRWRGAKGAGLVEIPANVRELTDAEALELAVIENNQREDLHPLEEAEGFEALLKCSHTNGTKYTVDDIVAKVGRSKSYVYQKLKLCELCPEARKAFYDGKVDFSRAILVARIAGPDLQRKALKEITEPAWHGAAAMSVRQAQDHIQTKYMLALERAPFPIKDANLVPKAGACAGCPKNTGTVQELFPDVKSGDTCTDPECFNTKRLAHSEALAAAARAKGTEVISGKDARKIAPHGVKQDLKGGYIALDKEVHTAKGWQTIRAIVGKDAPKPTLLADPDNGKLVDVVKHADIAAILKAKMPKESASASMDRARKQQKERERKEREERDLRQRLYLAGRDHVAKGLAPEDVRAIATTFWERLWHEHRKAVAAWWHPAEDAKGKKIDRVHTLEKSLSTMSGADLLRLMADCSMVAHVTATGGHGAQAHATAVESFAKRHGVDVAGVKRTTSQELKAKAAALATKKPAGKKKK